MTTIKIFFLSLFAALVLLSTDNVQAQTYKWEFGLEGGAGIRSLRLDPEDTTESVKSGIGFMGGIAGQYNISPLVSLRLGAAYERKGADLEFTSGSTTVKGKINVDYLSLPLTLKVKFGTGKKVNFFGNVGPYVGILLASKTKVDAFGGFAETESDDDSTTKKIDFGVAGGLGVDILVGSNMSFTIEARDNFGLTDINDSKEANATEIKTNTAQLILGFSWKFGKTFTRK